MLPDSILRRKLTVIKYRHLIKHYRKALMKKIYDMLSSGALKRNIIISGCKRT